MCVSIVNNLLRNPRSFHSAMVRGDSTVVPDQDYSKCKKERDISGAALTAWCGILKEDNPTTSPEFSQATQTAVHSPKQSAFFLSDFLSCFLFSVIAELKECQALYNATITTCDNTDRCEKTKSGFDTRI